VPRIRLHNITDSVSAYEAASGGSIPSGGTSFQRGMQYSFSMRDFISPKTRDMP
jgi:hypothetical protein